MTEMPLLNKRKAPEIFVIEDWSDDEEPFDPDSEDDEDEDVDSLSTVITDKVGDVVFRGNCLHPDGFVPWARLPDISLTGQNL